MQQPAFIDSFIDISQSSGYSASYENTPEKLDGKGSLNSSLSLMTTDFSSSLTSSFADNPSSSMITPESPPPYNGCVDSRTFVRQKKKTSLQMYSELNDKMLLNNTEALEQHEESSRDVKYEQIKQDYAALSNLNSSKLETSISKKRYSSEIDSSHEDLLSNISRDSSDKNSDMDDVNNIARLQEESLKSTTQNGHKVLKSRLHKYMENKIQNSFPQNTYNGAITTSGPGIHLILMYFLFLLYKIILVTFQPNSSFKTFFFKLFWLLYTVLYIATVYII